MDILQQANAVRAAFRATLPPHIQKDRQEAARRMMKARIAEAQSYGVQQPRQHAHAVVQQTAVGGFQDMRRGHRAVDAYPLPGFHPRVTRHTQQAPVDALPGRRAHRAHRRLQRRLPRQARRVHPRKALCGTRVAQRELQPPTGLLAQMLEHCTTQNRLAGQAVSPPRCPRLGAKIGSHLVEQLRVCVEPRRRPFQFLGDGPGCQG